MTYSARILLDTIASGARITTFELILPKWILAELNTHRAFSRNAASSRAIPVAKVIEQVEQHPVMPVWWGKNQPGMQANEELTGAELAVAKAYWLQARDLAVEQAKLMQEAGVHKQLTNRVLEPWMWAHDIVTATDFDHFFELRCHPDAQPEFRVVAEQMRDAYRDSTPAMPRRVGGRAWHLPYVSDDELALYNDEAVLKMSAARCARVSYRQHDGSHDPLKDLALADRLLASQHLSPFEHAAFWSPSKRHANLQHWCSFRTLKGY